jgi:hypothetical protein
MYEVSAPGFVSMIVAVGVAMPVMVVRVIARRVVVMLMIVVVITVIMMMTVAVIMIVFMTMAVRMVMAMHVTMCVVVAVSIGVIAGMGCAGIRPTLRIERRLDLDHPAAKPTHHLLDDMIAPDPQAARRDLGRQMPVAEVPGDPHQMLRIAAADLDQRLRCCDHLDDATVFQQQGVAAAQRDRLLKIEQEVEPAGTGHRHAPTVAVVEVEHDSIDRIGPLPPRRRQHCECAIHDGGLAGTINFSSSPPPGCRGYRTSTLAGVMTSIFGGAAKQFTATRPNARI